MTFATRVVYGALVLAAALTARTGAQTPGDLSAPYVVHERGPDRFPLSAAARSAPLYISSHDYVGVVRALHDLRDDIGRVTGSPPRLAVDTMPASRDVVIAGTLGRSPVIDGLVKAGRLDVSGVEGRWETFVLQTVDHPLPGVDRALVIAGSDKRGTIYGIYDLSEQIGVSPWYWWADVPAPHEANLYVLPGAHSEGTPAVKYRGIFINDESPAFTGWARAKFGGVNHQVYEHMFKLILRLKGNYLWPAMWSNAFNDDDKLDPVLADEYGVVMGTSHQEPMDRATVEWRRYGSGAWNYQTNDSTLHAFWTQGIRNMDHHETVVTIGMRGNGDMPMTEGSNIELLEKIVNDQRQIVADVTGKPASETPQDWALYKEVQDYYDKGMRVPDDVTLLFSDDNWGDIRRAPALDAKPRSGGYGMYYHFDYVGDPRSYMWINTNPIPKVWEQMHLAYEYGVRQIWVVNVGDLKPMEYPISFFLNYAWHAGTWGPEQLPQYARAWAAQQFGLAHAAEIADLITTDLKYAGRRKPELLDTATYSLTNYDEAQRIVADYDTLTRRATRVAAELPKAEEDAYYELVLHPIEAAATLNDLYVTVARNRAYAREGRALTNVLADSARALFDRDAAIGQYYNTKLAGGKWAHMMDQPHIGYTSWNNPPRNTMPRVDVIQLPAEASMGVAVVEENRAPPAFGRGFGFGRGRAGAPAAAGRGAATGRGTPPPTLSPEQLRAMFRPRPPQTPPFDPYERQTYHIDVYNKGTTSFRFSASAAQPWVIVTPASGTVTAQTRLSVHVDWNRAPVGEHQEVPITITGPDTTHVVVQATVDNPVAPTPDAVSGFVESGGVVSIEAAHHARAVGSPTISWVQIPDLGRTLSGVMAVPVTAPSQTPGGASPHLEYDLFMFDSGTVSVHAYLSPTLNYQNATAGLRYAVSIDGEAPQIVNIQEDTTQATWRQHVSDAIITSVTTHELASPGHHVLNFWLVDPGVVLQKLVVAKGELPPTYLGPPESYHRDAPPLAPGAARFDWFEYAGDDSVYDAFPAGAGEYQNPILAGFYPDPSMCRVGDDYYIVNSSFAYFPGVPIFHSRDLVHWTQIGSVLDRPSQLNLDSAGISRGIFAPVIREHAGTFYMITTLVDRGGTFIVTARNPAGPWSDPIWLPAVDGIDPSLFFDDDGRAYIVNNGTPIGRPLYQGHRAIWIQEYDYAHEKMIGPRTLIVNGGVDLSKHPIWIEAPHIFRVGPTYYLIDAEGGTAEQHSEVVFKSDSVFGPYAPYANDPILTQRQLDPSRPFPITSAGHADFVRTQNGEWWAVFLATRPYRDNMYNIGREAFMLPVHWKNGWPVMLEGEATVPYAVRDPKLPAQPAPAIPMNGNFTYRDQLSGPSLAPYWELMRTPRGAPWFDFTSTPGWLTMQGRPEDIGGVGQPSFIGRRQQHVRGSASTSMEYVPSKPGDKAGIVAFQSEEHYFFLGVTQKDGRSMVELERHAGKTAAGANVVVASAPVAVSADQPLYLRIDADGGTYRFYYAVRPGAWLQIGGDEDATILSTKVAGGFVGTMLGMYVYAPRP